MKNFWQKIKPSAGGPILALAPMAGITDSAFRQMCLKYGADVVYTEMVSADGLFYDSKKTLEFLKFAKKEHPVVVQLFGKYPQRFTKASQICESAGFDGIDINFGCPAKKVAGHGGGVMLMRDLPKSREIIEAVLTGTKLPVSIKLRTSIKKTAGSKENITALDFINYVKDLPISAVMIHGRSYEQLFSGEIDYEMIKKCVKELKKQNLKIVVLGNGGINTPEDAKIMIEKAKVDGVGVARGIYGKPWVFEQIKDYLTKGSYKNFSNKKIIKVAVEHAKAVSRSKGDYGLVELRKHLLWYVSGWHNAKVLRSKLVKIKSVSEVGSALTSD